MGLLSAYDPDWPRRAETEISRWKDALGPRLVGVHHIGSTAVPGLTAKPVIDLMPEIASDLDINQIRDTVEALHYAWLGPFGLPGRRYCRRDDPVTGARLFQAHCYPTGDPELTRHLAFRDALRADPALARAYANEKHRCASLHPGDRAAYGACKSGWIDRAEARALRNRKNG